MRDSSPSGDSLQDTGKGGPANRRRVDSKSLLGNDNELIIAHGRDEYRLRLTRQGKLILTK
ncbi:MAG: hemin uptake protein HemP [Ectothiorhodospiraceae bacterium]|nr:hemin uptake protein HemP [Ectothiorhodospiraceae bacterium]